VKTLLALTGAALLGGALPAGAPPVAPPVETVEVTVRWSRFDPAVIVVRPGTTVRFVVRNADPIDHELIVGPPEVHARHEHGTETRHDAPGELSLPAGAVASTIYRFDAPGPTLFACHLPGHFAYGMRGLVSVVRQ
jgi:uncharacterized cupredoxin-like copper-binding protein